MLPSTISASNWMTGHSRENLVGPANGRSGAAAAPQDREQAICQGLGERSGSGCFLVLRASRHSNPATVSV